MHYPKGFFFRYVINEQVWLQHLVRDALEIGRPHITDRTQNLLLPESMSYTV